MQQQFDEVGFVVLEDLLDEPVVAGARRKLNWTVNMHAGRLVEEDRITVPRLDEPFERRLIKLHQGCLDQAPLSFRAELHMVNVWTPLIPARPRKARKGCMQFIPGSHCLGVVEHVLRRCYLEIVESEIAPRSDDAVDVVCDPGDVVLFDNPSSSTAGGPTSRTRCAGVSAGGTRTRPSPRSGHSRGTWRVAASTPIGSSARRNKGGNRCFCRRRRLDLEPAGGDASR